jgi:hypothetical protein
MMLLDVSALYVGDLQVEGFHHEFKPSIRRGEDEALRRREQK